MDLVNTIRYESLALDAFIEIVGVLEISGADNADISDFVAEYVANSADKPTVLSYQERNQEDVEKLLKTYFRVLDETGHLVDLSDKLNLFVVNSDKDGIFWANPIGSMLEENYLPEEVNVTKHRQKREDVDKLYGAVAVVKYASGLKVNTQPGQQSARYIRDEISAVMSSGEHSLKRLQTELDGKGVARYSTRLAVGDGMDASRIYDVIRPTDYACVKTDDQGNKYIELTLGQVGQQEGRQVVKLVAQRMYAGSPR